MLVLTAATAAVAVGLLAPAAPASACTTPPSGPFWDAPQVCLGGDVDLDDVLR